MTLWALVPIKPLKDGKSRLSEVLADNEREALNKTLLIHTIETLITINRINQIAVVSHDAKVLRVAREYQVKTIQEDRRTNLNNALRKATNAICAYDVSQILIIPADLPLMTANDIGELLDKTHGAPEIIISPDSRLNGTNAILINPVGILDYEFGDYSFNKHIEQAQRKNIKIEIYNNDRIALDLDLPEDLKLISKLSGKMFI